MSLSEDKSPVNQNQTHAAQAHHVLTQQRSSCSQPDQVQEQADMVFMLQQKAGFLLEQTVNPEAEQPCVVQTQHVEHKWQDPKQQLRVSRELTGAAAPSAGPSSAEQLQQPWAHGGHAEAEANRLAEQTARVSTVQEQAESADEQSKQPQTSYGLWSTQTDNVVEQAIRVNIDQDSAESVVVQIQQPQLEQQNSSVFDQAQTVAQSLQLSPATAESSTAPAMLLLCRPGTETHSGLHLDNNMRQHEDSDELEQAADSGNLSPQSHQTKDMCSQSMQEQQPPATSAQSSQPQSMLSVRVCEDVSTQQASKSQADWKEAEGCSPGTATKTTALTTAATQSTELPDTARQRQAVAQYGAGAILVTLLCLTC